MVSEELKDPVLSAVAVLKRGGVIVFPTETSYGLGAVATDTNAIELLMKIKGRETHKTPPIIVASTAMAELYVDIEPYRELIVRFWPGPLTIVADVLESSMLSKLVIREGAVAIRVSSNQIARELSRLINSPIVATSANVAGMSACFSISCVRAQFAGRAFQPDYYLDVGALEQTPATTIVTKKDGELIVKRQGSLYVE